MNEILTLAIALVAGLVLGAIFFGGLWWTVRRGASSPRPARWFFASALLRMSVTLGGFYLVGGGQWERLLACLVGFVMARLAVTWLAQSPGQPRPAQEASHAP